MPDTRISYGDPLTDPQLQPGMTVTQDGFGLIQVQAKYKWDVSQLENFTAYFSRRVTPAPAPFDYCKLWKAELSIEKNGVVTVTADYVGIDQTQTGENRTYPQVNATVGSSSQPIEAHPNFIKVNAIYGGLDYKLAGFPPAKGGYDNDAGRNPNNALWTPYVASKGATQGFQFVGFLPNQTDADIAERGMNIKAGIKNYYKPQLTLRVLQYIGDEPTALTMASYVGWTNDGSLFNLPDEYIKLGQLGSDGYAGSPNYTDDWKNKINPGFLCTSCSVELFGDIMKVTTELMASGIAGWDPDIYPHLVD
jgi:hypothetical protein